MRRVRTSGSGLLLFTLMAAPAHAQSSLLEEAVGLSGLTLPWAPGSTSSLASH